MRSRPGQLHSIRRKREKRVNLAPQYDGNFAGLRRHMASMGAQHNELIQTSILGDHKIHGSAH